jgi:hypothetical protein
MIHKKLQLALKYLGLDCEAQAYALFSNLWIADYLSDPTIERCVSYLAAEKKFNSSVEQVLQDIKSARDAALQRESFDLEIFANHFCAQDYFSSTDIVEILLFLIQTSFDRKFGQERNNLKFQTWMENPETAQAFLYNCELLGLLSPKLPQRQKYDITVVMGGAYERAKSRISYLEEQGLLEKSKQVFLLTTDTRPLSVGLDGEENILRIAQALSREYNQANLSATSEGGRKVLNVKSSADQITEKDMMYYLYKEICSQALDQSSCIASVKQEGHWRATTVSNASSIAEIILKKPVKQKVYVAVISSQPDILRMEISVRNTVCSKLSGSSRVEIEGIGPGIDKALQFQKISEINSAQAALLSEFYNASKKQSDPSELFRNPNCLMFCTRDAHYEANQQQLTQMGNTSFWGLNACPDHQESERTHFRQEP